MQSIVPTSYLNKLFTVVKLKYMNQKQKNDAKKTLFITKCFQNFKITTLVVILIDFKISSSQLFT